MLAEIKKYHEFSFRASKMRLRFGNSASEKFLMNLGEFPSEYDGDVAQYFLHVYKRLQ